MSTTTEILAPRPRPSTAPDDFPGSYFAPPTPPPTNNRSHRPSLSGAMNWLSHKSSNSLTHIRYRTSSDAKEKTSTLRISEPYSLRDDLGELTPQLRTSGRALGMGAEVVATPKEAMERTVASPQPCGSQAFPKRDLPPIPQSPPGSLLRNTRSTPHLAEKARPESEPPQPMPAPVPFSSHTKTYSAPRAIVPPLTPTATPQVSGSPLPLPAIDIPPVVRQGDFEPILMSPTTPSYSAYAKPTQIIVTLETSTETFKTTLATLTSRPSALTTYLESFKDEDETQSAAQSAPPSPFSRVFADHLASQGLQAPRQQTNCIHIFLDRPSAPYAHMLSYLRSGALPRQVNLGDPTNASASYDAAKLETLLELRDEAAYLKMDSLVEACENEVKRWNGVKAAHDSRRIRSVRVSTSPPRTRKSSPKQTTPVLEPAHPVVSPPHFPQSVSETEPDILATVAPWAELGIRTSLSEEESIYAQSPAVVTRERPLPDAPATPAQRNSQSAVPVPGLQLRQRGRPSKTHVTDSNITLTPSAKPFPKTKLPTPPPSSTQAPRGNSFLPTMASPTSTKTGNWI